MAWYYYLNNQLVGPVDDAAVKNLIAAGTLTRNTLVWQEGMNSWQPVLATPLAAMLPPRPPPVPPAYAAMPMPQAAPAERVKQIKLFFMLWWILSAAGIAACPTACLMLIRSRLFAACLTFIGAVLAIVAGFVFHVMLMYKLWCTVQDGRAASTPGKAIGLMFIPFFWLYWQFVAIWGLSKDLNRYAREHNVAAPQANESLALTACILNCWAVIPYAGILAAIAGLIVLIIAVNRMCDTAAAIIRSPSA
jgi:hypothetical protein